MDALKAIEIRHSVRSYAAAKVEKEKVEAMISAAGNAPNAGEFHISVISDAGMLAEINDKAHTAMKNSGNAFLMERAAIPGYRPLYGAPLLLVFSAPPDNPYSQANTACAATSAIIAATSLGLGTCFAITPTLPLNADAALAGKAGIPKGMTAMCGVMAGYEGESGIAAPARPGPGISYCD